MFPLLGRERFLSLSSRARAWSHLRTAGWVTHVLLEPWMCLCSILSSVAKRVHGRRWAWESLNIQFSSLTDSLWSFCGSVGTSLPNSHDWEETVSFLNVNYLYLLNSCLIEKKPFSTLTRLSYQDQYQNSAFYMLQCSGGEKQLLHCLQLLFHFMLLTSAP